MKWHIPAKTFLLGEYAAIAGESAIVLTTTPCFELTLKKQPGLENIHTASPTARWWQQQQITDQGLLWQDPYKGQGGVGASSAQFLGAYLAANYLENTQPTHQALLDAYDNYAWQGKGLKPSGYDVLAQSLSGCVYINRKQDKFCSYHWPFQDIGFILLHTGKKLATHEHLLKTTFHGNVEQLTAIVDSARLAFELADSQQLIDAINAYHQALSHLGFVVEHSMKFINTLKNEIDIYAAKGCGALGADVLLLIVSMDQLDSLAHYFSANDWNILATNNDLYKENELIKNKT